MHRVHFLFVFNWLSDKLQEFTKDALNDLNSSVTLLKSNSLIQQQSKLSNAEFWTDKTDAVSKVNTESTESINGK